MREECMLHSELYRIRRRMSSRRRKKGRRRGRERGGGGKEGEGSRKRVKGRGEEVACMLGRDQSVWE